MIFESPKSHSSFNICLPLWIQTEGPDQNIVGYENLNLNKISLSFTLEKGRAPISRSFTKIVDATELQIITYERIIVKIRKKERGRGSILAPHALHSIYYFINLLYI